MSAEDWTEVERAYSPSSMVADLSGLIEEYRLSSEAARAAHPPVTHRYGSSPVETLDVFAAGPGAPAHVFVHGGYWQELGKDDSSFPATGFLRSGITYVAVNYGLAPGHSLDQIVEQVRSALAWVYEHAGALGIDARRIVVSGSSAGAHLAAMAALTDWTRRGLPPDLIRGVVLLSGIYDLRPLLGTYINDAVGLDPGSAHRNSPLHHVTGPGDRPPGIIAWGEYETGAFKEQSRRLAEAWRTAGGPVVTVEAAGRNHFDIVHDLSEPDTSLGGLVHAQGRKWEWR